MAIAHEAPFQAGIIVSVSPVSSLPPRGAFYAARVPASLSELRGPASGRLELPLQVCWSGRSVYDLDDPAQLLPLYALLIAQASAADLVHLANAELLLELWPRLRPLVGPNARRVWDPLLSGARTRA